MKSILYLLYFFFNLDKCQNPYVTILVMQKIISQQLDALKNNFQGC